MIRLIQNIDIYKYLQKDDRMNMVNIFLGLSGKPYIEKKIDEISIPKHYYESIGLIGFNVNLYKYLSLLEKDGFKIQRFSGNIIFNDFNEKDIWLFALKDELVVGLSYNGKWIYQCKNKTISSKQYIKGVKPYFGIKSSLN